MTEEFKLTEITTALELHRYSVGLLGAVTNTLGHAQDVRLIEIERRILRIEMALRRAGIEVEAVDFPA